MIYIVKAVGRGFDNYYERVLFATKREELAREYTDGLNHVSDLYEQVIKLVESDYMPEWDKDNPKPSPKYSNDISKLQRSYYCDRELYRKSKINELFLQLADQKFLNLCKKFNLKYESDMGYVEYQSIELIELMSFT